MTRTSIVLPGILFVLLISPVCHAWDRIGHMIVAGIAFDQLSKPEQEKLTGILNNLPNSEKIFQGLGTDGPAGRELVMAASTWPDLIKTDSRYKDNGYNEPGPLQSIKISDLKHKGWHFIDIPCPFAPGARTTFDPNNVNIVQVLGVLDQQLRKPMAVDERAYEIAWLLHLVGDIHQPLHCAQGFDAQNPQGDVGGNKILTQDPVTHEKELHAFWDDILGKDTASTRGRLRLDLDVAKASSVISTLANPSTAPGADNIDFQKWADDTHKLAVDDGYGELRINVETPAHGETNVDSVIIDDDYRSMATRVAQKQVQLAGHRLATLLKAYLKE